MSGKQRSFFLQSYILHWEEVWLCFFYHQRSRRSDKQLDYVAVLAK
jgi:hypothetical protein